MTTRHRAPAHVDLVHTMGTVVSLDVRAADRPPNLDAAFAAVADRLHAIDDLFSTWRADSWASRLARGEVGLAECPAQLRDVVATALRLTRVTDGYFSVHWRRAAAPTAGPDPTGLVKGWAAQRASDVLLAHGLGDHVVNAAGDLVVSGSPALASRTGSVPWRVGISDPAGDGGLAGSLVLPPPVPHRWAVATSGLAEQGAHILDPHTGLFPTSVLSATAVVLADHRRPEAGAWADAAATALVAAGADAAALLSRLRDSGVRGFVLHAGGRTTDPDLLLVR